MSTEHKVTVLEEFAIKTNTAWQAIEIYMPKEHTIEGECHCGWEHELQALPETHAGIKNWPPQQLKGSQQLHFPSTRLSIHGEIEHSTLEDNIVTYTNEGIAAFDERHLHMF